MTCELSGDRVVLRGKAVATLKGSLISEVQKSCQRERFFLRRNSRTFLRVAMLSIDRVVHLLHFGIRNLVGQRIENRKQFRMRFERFAPMTGTASYGGK